MMPVQFAPLAPIWLLALLALGGLAAIAWAHRAGLPTALRLLPLAALLLALANPRLVVEQSRGDDDIVVVIVDDSPSMSLGDRARQRDNALAELRQRLRQLPNLDVRVERVAAPPGLDRGTRLFDAADRALADVPRRRLAGLIMITDGQVNDVPDKPTALGAPLHVLLAGHRTDRDRRLVIERAPGYAMTGTSASLSVHIEDPGQTGTAQLAVRRDGGPLSQVTVALNHAVDIPVPIDHPGANVVELEAAPVPGELTEENNRAVASITGVRERLRVLLVSGEPYIGERTWRNLLKADPAVDLVHFTILRAPDKDDRTPLKELSLIPFPVRELFEQKLHDFDLIIFDRCRRSVVPAVYYRNIADYVKGGGGLLVATGPEFAGADSPFATPLADVLPLVPDGRVTETPFRPELTDIGRRHPVTGGLPGSDDKTVWGRWMRLIGAQPRPSAVVLLAGADGAPLLGLAHAGDGRVAQLMSDTAWLWDRGWDGGGPQAELLRRLAHWLMKEPALEEERLTAVFDGNRLAIARQSLTGEPGDVTVTAPDGGERRLTLSPGSGGVSTGSLTADVSGLWRIDDGAHVALAALGSPNPIEMAEVRATADKLKPAVAATGGGIAWLDDGLPIFHRVRDGALAGSGWMGLRQNDDRTVISLSETPLVPGWLFLIGALGGLALAWWREGR
jgi:hypothetical protein